MCTVSYLPVSEDSFFLTHNRDEHIARQLATPPSLEIRNGKEIIFPKDMRAGGTWFASSATHSLCLLNGAFEKHIPNPPYRKSRGSVILDFFNWSNTMEFVKEYDFLGIENFTLIVVDHQPLVITELIWDGKDLQCNSLDPTLPFLRSSVTLYETSKRKTRENWFSEFLKKDDITQEEIIAFHKFNPQGDEGFIIHREDKLKTLSLTSLCKEGTIVEMHYEDFIQHKKYSIELQ